MGKTALAADLNIDEFIENVRDRPAIWNRGYHCNKSYMEKTWSQLSKIHNLPMVTLKAKWKGLRDNFRVEFKRIPRDDNGELLIEADKYNSKWASYKALLFLSEHMRSRDPKNEPIDSDHSYFFEIDNQRNNSHFEDESSCTADDVINIPDDDIFIGKESIAHFDGIPVNMGRLEVPNGSAASLVEPVLIDNFKMEDTTGKASTRKSQRIKAKDSTPYHRDSVTLSPQPYQIVPAAMPSPTLGSNDRFMDDDYHFLMSLHPYMAELNSTQKLRLRMKMQKLVYKELYKDDVDIE